MVKVTKREKEKRRQDKEKYLASQAKISHSVKDNMLYIIRELWKNNRLYFFVMLGIPVFQTIENLLRTFRQKYVIDLALGADSRVRLAIICVGIILFIELVRYCTNRMFEYSNNVGGWKFESIFIRRFIVKNMSADYENNEKASVNDMLHKARNVVGHIQKQSLKALSNTVGSLLGIFAFGSLLSTLSPWLIPIIAFPAVAGYYINRHKMGWIWNMADNWQIFERQLEYITHAQTDFSYAKDVRIYGMQKWLKDLFDRSFKKRLEWYRQQDAWEVRHDLLETFIRWVGYFAAYAFVIYGVYEGSLDVGEFVLYFNSIGNLSTAVRKWCDNYSGYRWLSENISYVRDYFEMKDNTNRGKGLPLPEGECEIEFKNVSYTYSCADTPTIKNLSFTLHKGEKLALVGLNGAGKTTIVKLMCGLYDPTEGEILLNGQPVNKYNREEYFTLFSTVFQDIPVLPMTLAENISGETETDRERLRKALEGSGLYQKVMTLTEKENTKLVKSVYENGTELSGGELQKLALAKALYKNSKILLLDEPTAALDPISEQKMYLSYAEFSKGKSSIFISHRLASTRFCHRIIMIQDGGIAEEGSHDELMALGGRYAQLFELQSSYYRDGKEESHEE